MVVIERHVFETKIIGEMVRLSCDVSEERLRRVSECINRKAEEIQKIKRGLPVSTPLFKLLVNVNLADSLIDAQDQLAQQRAKNAALEKELTKIKLGRRDYEKQPETKD